MIVGYLGWEFNEQTSKIVQSETNRGLCLVVEKSWV